MSTSAIGTVLDALRAALILRANLTGVQVYSAAVSLEEAGLESIEFGDAELVEEELAMGGSKLETWDVECALVGQAKPWQGDTEATIKAARDRALALFAEVETHVNDTYTGTYPHVVVAAGKLESGYGPETRACRLTFTLRVMAVKNP